MHRRSQRTFDTPSTTQTTLQRRTSKPQLYGPVSQAHGDAAEVEHSIPTCVSGLFSASGPFAVVWSVAFVVIDALKSGSVGSWPHITHEVTKVGPLSGIGNSTATVIPKVLIVGVAAPVLHGAPHLILPPKNLFSNFYSRTVLCDDGPVQAAATLSVSAFQVAAGRSNNRSALTFTGPDREPAASRSFFCLVYGRQASENLSRQICTLASSWHGLASSSVWLSKVRGPWFAINDDPSYGNTGVISLIVIYFILVSQSTLRVDSIDQPKFSKPIPTVGDSSYGHSNSLCNQSPRRRAVAVLVLPRDIEQQHQLISSGYSWPVPCSCKHGIESGFEVGHVNAVEQIMHPTSTQLVEAA